MKHVKVSARPKAGAEHWPCLRKRDLSMNNIAWSDGSATELYVLSKLHRVLSSPICTKEAPHDIHTRAWQRVPEAR
jgi:hypothetical protein